MAAFLGGCRNTETRWPTSNEISRAQSSKPWVSSILRMKPSTVDESFIYILHTYSDHFTKSFLSTEKSLVTIYDNFPSKKSFCVDFSGGEFEHGMLAVCIR